MTDVKVRPLLWDENEDDDVDDDDDDENDHDDDSYNNCSLTWKTTTFWTQLTEGKEIKDEKKKRRKEKEKEDG